MVICAFIILVYCTRSLVKTFRGRHLIPGVGDEELSPGQPDFLEGLKKSEWNWSRLRLTALSAGAVLLVGFYFNLVLEGKIAETNEDIEQTRKELMANREKVVEADRIQKHLDILRKKTEIIGLNLRH